MRDVVGATLRREGFRGLYKGMSPPLAAQGIYKAVIFSTRNRVQSILSTRRGASKFPRTVEAFSGLAAGCVNSLIVAPVELVRNRLQVNTSMTRRMRPFDVLRQVLLVHGPLTLLKGAKEAALRDGPGVALYFLAYSESMKHLGDREMGPFCRRLASACIAGVAFWIWALPFDTLKTAIQRAGNERTPSFTIVKKMYRNEGGIPRFFRGWQAAYVRGIPSAATTFLTYEYLKDMGW